jgi:DNA-binding LacI/PurR family transcriptional regulator
MLRLAMGSRGVGIKDVARAAGVSTTTVSHALSGKGRLPEETRARVRGIAQDMGYRPSAVARGLAAGRTGVLGIAFSVPDALSTGFLDIPWYPAIVNAATQRAMRDGYALVVVPPAAGPEVWGRLPLDGTIVVEPIADDPNLLEIAAHRVRLVSIGRAPGVDGWWVDNDNGAAVIEALELLRERGARRVALASVAWLTTWHDEAIAAYRAWCERHEVEPVVVESADPEVARPGLAALLDGPDRPDAVFSLYERLGSGLIELARERGIRVPEDLLLAAASDDGSGMRCEPQLSTIDFDPEALGGAAAGMLIDLVEGREPVDRSLLLPARLVERGSTTGLVR